MSKFKIGDRVKVIKEHPDTYWNIGMEGVIDYLRDSPLKYHVVGDKGRLHNLAEEQLELVTEAPKRPFKVGDKVRIVAQRRTLGGLLSPSVLDSSVYTIIEADNSTLPYKVKPVNGGSYSWCTAEQLELVAEQRLILKDNPALSPSKHTFKKGDKVRVISHRPPASDLPVVWAPYMDKYFGEVGTVRDVYMSGVTRVAFDNGDVWTFDPAWLTPAIEITFGGRSIADAWREAIASLCNPKKDKTNIKTKLISNTKLLTNIKLN